MTLGANLNGTVIARNIDVQAESHRTDLMMFSVDPGGNTLEIPVGKDWQSDETFEVEAVLIRIDVQGRQTECDSLRLNESNRWRGTFEEVEKSDADGNEYVYQVKERVGSVMHGDGDALVYGGETYSVSIRGTPADGFLITNRRQAARPARKGSAFPSKSGGTCAPPARPLSCDDPALSERRGHGGAHADAGGGRMVRQL